LRLSLQGIEEETMARFLLMGGGGEGGREGGYFLLVGPDDVDDDGDDDGFFFFFFSCFLSRLDRKDKKKADQCPVGLTFTPSTISPFFVLIVLY